MRKFKTIDDVVKWLEPMDYQGFWAAIAPYDLVLQRREHCDSQIASGEIDLETVLDVLKSMARMELTQRHDLHWKMPHPWVKLVVSN